MQTFEWNVRTVVTVFIATLLVVSVGVMGGWLLLSGQPGTGMMEGGDLAGMIASGEHGEMMGAELDQHGMGPTANRGMFGGYTGTVGLFMILVFMALVGLLLFTLLHERPGQPQSASCWNCERPVETDWTSCPYCGVALVEAGRPSKPIEA